MNKFGISRNNIIAILFATCIFIPVGAVSIGSILGGFRVGAFKTEIDAHTICKQVSANDGEEYFIGTKTEQEWESVHDNTNIPSGLDLTDCSCVKDLSNLEASILPVGNPPGVYTDISVDGDRIALGDSQLKKVHIFIKSGDNWLTEQVITFPGRLSDGFGARVFLEGNTLFIGAPGDDNTYGTNGGAIYVYTKSGSSWTQQQKIISSKSPGTSNISSDSSYFARDFGFAFSADGDYLAASIPRGGVGGKGMVQMYKFNGSSWVEEYQINNPDTRSDSGFFGGRPQLYGDRLVVGYQPNTGFSNFYIPKATHSFTRSGTNWGLEQTLDLSINNLNALMPNFDGNRIAISLVGYDASYVLTTLFKIFELQSGVWTEISEITPAYYTTLRPHGDYYYHRDSFSSIGPIILNYDTNSNGVYDQVVTIDDFLTPPESAHASGEFHYSFGYWSDEGRSKLFADQGILINGHLVYDLNACN